MFLQEYVHEALTVIKTDECFGTQSTIMLLPPDNAGGNITDEDTDNESNVKADNLLGIKWRIWQRNFRADPQKL